MATCFIDRARRFPVAPRDKPPMTPFYTSPIVIHLSCGPGSRPRTTVTGGRRDLLADVEPPGKVTRDGRIGRTRIDDHL